jgi:phosphoenolpyruvate carboxylase
VQVEVVPPKEMSLPDILESKLILQSYLDYLRNNGPDKFGEFVNNTLLRLVSTVHPNETERTTNLMHYTSVLEKYFEWKKDYQSIQTLPTRSAEYKIRREKLNQLRRAIKAEIEGLWCVVRVYLAVVLILFTQAKQSVAQRSYSRAERGTTYFGALSRDN